MVRVFQPILFKAGCPQGRTRADHLEQGNSPKKVILYEDSVVKTLKSDDERQIPMAMDKLGDGFPYCRK